jgi:AcrR family transcriptional regulator
MTDSHDALPPWGEARTRILLAARDLLESKAAQLVCIRDIAKRANVSPALLMRHDRSQDALVFQAIMASLETIGTPPLLDCFSLPPI